MSLSLDNNLLTESFGNEYIIGFGYRFKNLRMNTRIGGRRSTLKGDLNIKADMLDKLSYQLSLVQIIQFLKTSQLFFFMIIIFLNLQFQQLFLKQQLGLV